MKGTMKMVLILAVIILSGGAFCLFMDREADSRNSEAIKTARAYLYAVATLDKEKAQQLSIGYAKTNLQAMQAGEAKDVSVEDVDCEVLVGNEKAQDLIVRTEVWKNQQPYIDYYRVRLIDTMDGWRVYSMEEDRPSHLQRGVSGKPADYWNSIVRDYMKTVEKGDWNGSLKYLVGPAQKGQAKTMHLLSGLVIKTPEDIKSAVVMESERHVSVIVSYMVSGNESEVVAEFERTREGWKIYEITPL